jgi:hypothetical protein
MYFISFLYAIFLPFFLQDLHRKLNLLVGLYFLLQRLQILYILVLTIRFLDLDFHSLFYVVKSGS